MMTSELESKKAPCGKCGRETNHTLCGKTNFDDVSDHDGYPVGYYNWWELLQCNGCSYAQLKAGRFFSEWDQQFDNPEIFYWPPHERRARPDWLDRLDDSQRQSLEETYTAFDLGLMRLAMMGVRSFVDLFLTILVGDVGGFDQKLRAAEKQQHIGPRERQMLEAAIEAGHAAIHRGHTPSAIDVTTALEVAESVVGSYRLGTEADSLKERTPKRGD